MSVTPPSQPRAISRTVIQPGIFEFRFGTHTESESTPLLPMVSHATANYRRATQLAVRPLSGILASDLTIHIVTWNRSTRVWDPVTSFTFGQADNNKRDTFLEIPFDSSGYGSRSYPWYKVEATHLGTPLPFYYYFGKCNHGSRSKKSLGYFRDLFGNGSGTDHTMDEIHAKFLQLATPVTTASASTAPASTTGTTGTTSGGGMGEGDWESFLLE